MTIGEDQAPEELRRWFDEMPVMRLLSARLTALEPGSAEVTLTPAPEELNPNGAVNGGIIAAVADLTGGFLVMASGPASEYASTADLAVHYMVAARALPVTMRARMLRRGRRMCFVQIDVVDADGTLCAVATGSWALMPDSPHAPRAS